MDGGARAPTLAGRDAELGRIDAALADARSGRPRILVILGEAGIGKTALAGAACARASADGCEILVGACLDIGEGRLPYLPVAEAIRGLARRLAPDVLDAALGPARADLEPIVPVLLRALPGEAAAAGADAPAKAPSGAGQARLFERFIGLLARLGAGVAVLVVIEDVQWVDRATRDLVTFLVRNLTSENVAMILTCRTGDLPAGHEILVWLAELGRAPGAGRIDLGPLDRDSVARMVAGLAGTALDPADAERMWHRSDGNPLFVEELFAAERAPASGGALRSATLVETLVARVATLAPFSKSLVDAVAVAARPVGEDVLAALLGSDDASVAARVREAIDHGVLVMDAERQGFRFRHELLREAVERALLPGERRTLHERYARLLEARPDLVAASPAEAAAELAFHWIGSGRAPEAHRASLAAADAAEAVHAFGEAHGHLERALQLETRLPPSAEPPPAERAAIRRRAADVADLAGSPGRAIELTREALALVDPAADPATAGLLHGRLGYLAWATGDGVGSIAEHEEAVRLVPSGPSAERAHVLAGLGGALMGAGRWAASRVVSEEAVACAAGIGDPAEESRARSVLGSDLVALGEIDAGIEELRRARALAEPAGPSELLVAAHYNLALNLLQADRPGDALAEAQAGRDAAHAAGLHRRFGQEIAALAGDCLLRLGRWTEAESVTGDALATVQPAEVVTYLGAVRGRLLALRGDATGAAGCLGAIDDSTLDPDVAAYVGQVRAEAALADGLPTEALRAVDAGLRALDGLDDVLWTAPLVALGLRAAAEETEAARALRDGPRAAKAASAAGRLRDRAAWLERRAAAAGTRAWVALALAEATRIDGAPAAAAWVAAGRLWVALGDPFAAAYCRFRGAEAALRAAGIGAEVGAELRTAHDAARSLRAEPLRFAIETLARRARIPLEAEPAAAGAPGSPPGPSSAAGAPELPPARRLGLSSREIEVLELVAAGLSNGEIAERLFITRKTAGVHVTHILAKLGLANRVEAAMVAARIGLTGAGPGGADIGPGGADAGPPRAVGDQRTRGGPQRHPAQAPASPPPVSDGRATE